MVELTWILDFISTKPINVLPNNFIGAESETLFSNGAFQFERHGKGHEFVREMLEDLALNYNRLEWAANGPALFTRVYRKFCSVPEDMPLTPQTSYPCGISVTNSSVFFPVYYPNWMSLFEPTQKESIKDMLKNTVAVHFWNYLSKNEIVKLGENSPYELIAREYCKKF
uniref:Lactosylceramide 4-alpha-galactosyltransferase n=1 Tax=Triatoma infestans TaxID=30076 RepID=A0A170ZRL6_TRIIF